ncbi:TetR/AcrR family transcriptional regulator [Streptomyces sp. NPDC052114]|uniref:TetR/AcrR family transcriptional regulator n=1 Tax=unclassified Streptomyces TaxID=2593676 RepID=UPI003427506A
MIVAAALPLVAEYGAAVTTGQIARAAGIGEATIFRAFKDKDEVLDACVHEAVSPDHVVRELASIPLDEPLAERLTQAADALRAHLERMGAVVGGLHATGRRRGRPSGPSAGERPDQSGREASVRALREGLADLVEPDRAALRHSPEKIAAIFLGMLFSGLRGPVDGLDPTPADLVDVLLHGALGPRPESDTP